LSTHKTAGKVKVHQRKNGLKHFSPRMIAADTPAQRKQACEKYTKNAQ
jgi:hypothetical protein